MKRTPYFVVLLPAMIVGLIATCAAEKRVVAVRFRIEASTYRSHFTSPASLEAQVTQDLVQTLKRNVSFLDFAADSGASGSYILTVTLAVPDPMRGVATQRVMLYSSLAAPDGTELKTRWQWLKYRDPLSECSDLSDSHCRIPAAGEFADEVHVLLSAANYSELVKNVLREVPILAGTGKLLAQPVAGWVLPFRQTEICLDLQSQFRVAGTVPSPAADIPGTFLAEMEGPYRQSPDSAVFGMLLRGESEDDDRVKKPIFLQNPDAVVVKAVYVVQYRRFSDGSCGGAIPPATSGNGGPQ